MIHSKVRSSYMYQEKNLKASNITPNTLSEITKNDYILKGPRVKKRKVQKSGIPRNFAIFSVVLKSVKSFQVIYHFQVVLNFLVD